MAQISWVVDKMWWGDPSDTQDYSAYVRTIMVGPSGLEEAVTHWKCSSIAQLKEQFRDR